MTLHLDAETTFDAPAGPPQLNQPLRAVVAVAEVLLFVGLMLVTVWAWGNATVQVPLPPSDNPAIPPVASSTDGRWMAAAVGMALLGGLLLLDAVRQTLLAVRTGGRR